MRGTIEFPVFASVYEKTSDLLEGDEPLLVTGRVNHREDDVSLYAETISPLSKIREKEASKSKTHGRRRFGSSAKQSRHGKEKRYSG